MLRQYPITPAAGKRLIGKGLLLHPALAAALRSGKLVIVAGSTNGYVAEEILASLGQSLGFARNRFFRGLTLAPGLVTTPGFSLPDAAEFPGDVVLVNGVWQRAATVFDVADLLVEGDVILKGGNALDLAHKQAAVFIEHPRAGTTGAILPAVLGRRARLIVPIGLEKRVPGELSTLAMRLAEPEAKGPRLCPLPGEVFTELDALRLCTGAQAELVAAGGVSGAEGCVWLAIEGTADQMAEVDKLMRAVHAEPAFSLA